MTQVRRYALHIPFGKLQLAATLHAPASPHSLGVVFVVGGNQIRAGSHRQFLLLARAIADAGHACLRFDLPGLGDSEGPFRNFDESAPALRATIDALLQRVPDVTGILLWGLCDGASASILYAHHDVRVKALFLANPWIRDDEAHAKTLIRSYYGSRLFSAAFWRKLLSGRIALGRSFLEWLRNWRMARTDGRTTLAEKSDNDPLAALAAQRGALTCKLVLAGNDLTGLQFAQAASAAGLDLPSVKLDGADHTFSSTTHHDSLRRETLQFLESLAAR